MLTQGPGTYPLGHFSGATVVHVDSCVDWQTCSQDRQACLVPVLVLADAAFEDNKATLRILPVAQSRTEIGGNVSSAWWIVGTSCVAKKMMTFAVLLALISFRHILFLSMCNFWIDARYSMTKGVSPNLALLQTVQFYHSCPVEINPKNPCC